MNRNLLPQLLILLIFCVLVSIGAKKSRKAVYAAKSAKGNFENLQVLPENISEDSLDMLMGMYKTALGVKCGFCHAKDADTSKHRLDFASDAKEEKLVARKMMKMTYEINKNYFAHDASKAALHSEKVNCYSCHRGSRQPLTFEEPQGPQPQH